MKTSYPFLRISQKHNLPYEDVLMAAEYAKYYGQPPGSKRAAVGYTAFRYMPEQAMREIRVANDEMDAMRHDLLNWQERHEVS